MRGLYHITAPCSCQHPGQHVASHGSRVSALNLADMAMQHMLQTYAAPLTTYTLQADTMGKMDTARRDLLAAARDSEKLTFVGKDVVGAILDFCTLKKAEPEIITPRHFNLPGSTGAAKGTRIPPAPGVRRESADTVAGGHVDQADRVRRLTTPAPATYTPAPVSGRMAVGELRHAGALLVTKRKGTACKHCGRHSLGIVSHAPSSALHYCLETDRTLPMVPAGQCKG